MTDKHVMMVIFTTKPGQQETVRAMLTAMVAKTRIEKGCEQYTLHQSIDSDLVFAFYETWTSKRDWEIHMETAHLNKLLADLPQHLAAEIQVVNLKTLAVG